jgi:hypothetical protein
MSDKPSPEDLALWQRRLAGQANNRAWSLAEQPSRTPQEDEEMLHAAHAAMHFWNLVGNAGHKAHAAQLLAHVHAALKQGEQAAGYLARSQPVLMAPSAEAWERALAHAVAANVAAARGDASQHAEHHRQATQQVAALPDPQDRAILEDTLRVLPVPAANPEPASPSTGATVRRQGRCAAG